MTIAAILLPLMLASCGSGDAAVWIVEGVNREGYCFIIRWSPAEGLVREFGDFALGLTRWTFEEIY